MTQQISIYLKLHQLIFQRHFKRKL